MKLCAFTHAGARSVGVLTDRGIVDITAHGLPDNMNDVIEGGDDMLRRIAELKDDLRVVHDSEITFLPVTSPRKIVCEGLNYKKHAEETGGEAPKYPIFFNKFLDTLSEHNGRVTLPTWQERYDYEAELVVIVGKRAYNITPEEAPEYIFGYTCGNDLSARDSQFLSSQWLSGKTFPGFAPTGPFLVTRDEFDPGAPHAIFCKVNGRTVQHGDTSDMIFPCAEALSCASRHFPLDPGDLLFTGTPAGVIQGLPRDERVWLKPGDTVSVTIEGIGTLETYLV